MDLDRLEREIADLADDIDRRTARWLELVAEFDALDGARHAGFRSTAEWLAWRCSIDLRTARDHVRVARALRNMPLIRAEFRSGGLSYSKVRALATVAGREDESELLELARSSSAAQLGRTVRSLRSAPSADEDIAERAWQRRFVQWYWEEDGSLSISGRLPAEEGAAFIEAIESAAESLHPPAEGRPPLGARHADALAEVVLSGCPRAQVVLHVDAPALSGQRDGSTCALEDGPAVPSETARRLACDADLVVALPGPDGVPDYGRRRRVVSPALRRSLERRDRRCQFPDCARRHGLHAHHIDHWGLGGGTDRDNLLLLCRFHHRAVHEGGFTVARVGGQVEFRRPDGRAIPHVPERGPPVAAAA